MKVPRQQLAAAIAERTLSVRNSKQLAQAVAAYLLTENRVDELEPLMRDVLAYREQHGIIEAEAVSAHELEAGVTRELAAVLKQHYPAAQQVHVHTSLDPHLVGGVQVQLSHEQLDLSVRGKLNTLKRLTSEGTVS